MDAPQSDKRIKKVLIVEDDNFLLSLLGSKLSSSGFTLFSAKEGAEALDIAEKKSPDMILLDLLLPGMDGFQVLEKLKSNDATKHIPVTILSNLSGADDYERTMKLGATQFFTKSNISLEQVVDYIKKFDL
jgi:two-component system cell cycle response regulator